MTHSPRSHRSARASHGFSLVELAVVLVIVSVLGAGAIVVGRNQENANRWQIARDRMDAIDSAIQTFYTAHRYLPCPASTLAAPNTSAFGMSTACDATVALPLYVYDKNVSGLGNDLVRYGSIPTRTLDLPESYGVDPWGNRFMLVEVAGLGVNSTTYTAWAPTASYPSGPIQIIDANGNQVTDSGSGNVVAYVIMTSGPDGVSGATGGTNPMSGPNGSVARNGGYFSLVCSGTQDAENCNAATNNIFRDQRYDPGTSAVAKHYDDLILWRLKSTLQ